MTNTTADGRLVRQIEDDVTLPITVSNTTVEQNGAPVVPGIARCRLIIVIPTLNEATHIETVVEHLAGELSEFAQAKIVVVDGGSTDGTQAIVTSLAQQHPALHLLHNEKHIQSAGVNLAARQFGRNADILIRCDAHATYPTQYCARLIHSIERTGADSVVIPMDSVGHSPLQRAVAWASNSIVGTGGSAHRAGRQSGFVDHGHHAAFRIETFRRIGGYNETFTQNEDSEFDCRQRAHGAKIYLDADIRVQYCPRPSWRALARQYYRYGLGRSRTLRRHPASLRLRQLLVPLNLVILGLAIGFSPWCASLLLWPALYLAALGATSVAIAVRQRSVAGLLAGPAAGLMHTTWAVGLIEGLFLGHDRKWQSQQAVPLWASASGDNE